MTSVEKTAARLVRQEQDSLKRYHKKTFDTQGLSPYEYVESMEMSREEDACYIAGAIDGIKLLADKLTKDGNNL